MRKSIIMLAFLMALAAACSDDGGGTGTTGSTGSTGTTGTTGSTGTTGTSASVVGTWVKYEEDNKQGGYDSQVVYNSDGTWSEKMYTNSGFYYNASSQRGQWGFLPDGRIFHTFEEECNATGDTWTPLTEQRSNIYMYWIGSDRIVSAGYLKEDSSAGLDGAWIRRREYNTFPAGTLDLDITTLTISGTNAAWSNYQWSSSSGTGSGETNLAWIVPAGGQNYILTLVDLVSPWTNVYDVIWDGSTILAVDVNDDDVLWK